MKESGTQQFIVPIFQRQYNEVRVHQIASRLCLMGLTIGTILVAATAFSSISYIFSYSIVDDSFYYLLPAYHVTHGQALAFDGINTTNGFNPLWMAILLPLAGLAGNREMLLRLTLVYQALLYSLAAWLLVRAALRRGNLVLAVLTTLVWVVFGLRRDLTFNFVTNGLESALYFLMLALAFVITLHAVEDEGTATSFFHPITMALLVLSRLDAVFFAFPLTLYLFWKRSRQWTVKAAIRSFLPGWTVGGILLLTYIGWNLYSVGVALPVSGSIKMFHTREMALNQFGGFATSGHVFKMIETFWRSLALIGTLVLGALLPIDISNSLRVGLVNLPAFGPSAATLVCSTLLFGLLGISLFVSYRRGLHYRLSPWQVVTLLFGLGALAHLIFHSVTLWLYAYYNVWHYVGEIFALLILAASATDSLLHLVWQRRRTFATTILIFIIAATGYAQKGAIKQQIKSVITPYPWQPTERSGLYRAAAWTNAHLPEETRLGAWNAGISGFFTSHPVTNLDGLINGRDLYQRILRHEFIGEYIVQQDLSYLIDYAPGGAWPVPEVGGIHYFDLYASQSAAFVMDTSALQSPSSIENEREPTAWIVVVRTISGELEQWIGTAWPSSLAGRGQWRIVDDQNQIIVGPFDMAPTWLPEVPPPPRTQQRVLIYKPLPAQLDSSRIFIQFRASGENWSNKPVAEVTFPR